MGSTGIVYIATRAQMHVEQACISARSVRRVMPDVPITLLTDQAAVPGYWDQVLRVESRGPRSCDKPLLLWRSPYERTLFLDNDTYVCADLSDVFTLLDRFDLAAVHEPHRSVDWNRRFVSADVPPSFVELNTGVLAFHQSERMIAFLSNWLALHDREYQDHGINMDQPTFRVALYRSDLRFATLPSEYNCRFHMGGYLRGQVKVLHGAYQLEPAYLKQVERALSAEGPRVHIAGRVFLQQDVGRVVRRRISRLVGRFREPQSNIWLTRLRVLRDRYVRE